MVNTCGVCEMIVDQDKIPNHPCMEGYNRVYFDDNYYFYPTCGKTNKNFYLHIVK